MSTAIQWNEFADYVSAVLSDSTLPDTCSIQANTDSDDNAGGWGSSWSDLLTNVPCRFSDGAGMEELLAGAQQGFLDGVVFLPAKFNGSAINLTNKKRIVVNARGSEPARTFEIIGFGPSEGVLISAMVKAAQS